MASLVRSLGLLLNLVALLAVSSPVPSSTTVPSSKPVAIPKVDSTAAQLMQMAIDETLSTAGYGKLCVDGPESFPAVVYSDDEGLTLQVEINELLDIGLIRVVSTRTVFERVTETQYDLTQAGSRLYTTYRRLGFSGDVHGWCYAEYRVGSIVSSESGPFCRHPSQVLTGFAEPEPRCVTIVTYLPKLISVADWTRSAQARILPEVSELDKFPQAPRTATLVPFGDFWQMSPMGS